MSGLRERPRMAVALCAALVVIVVVSMLVGGAIAGGGDCPTAHVAADHHNANAKGKAT
jgi:hypothetical protein